MRDRASRILPEAPEAVPIPPAPVRWAGRVFSILASPLAARTAAFLFGLPKKAEVRPEEAEVLSRAERFTRPIEGRRIQGYSWGSGPVIFGAHGWGSRGSRFGWFVDPIVAAGYRFVTWDAPAHGDSEGRTTNAPTIARSMRAFLDEFEEVRAVVAHSLGCWAAALAFQDGLDVQRAVFVSPPGDLEFFSRAFVRAFGFTPAVHARMERLFVSQTGIPWSHFSASEIARGQDTPLLVFHDTEDRTVPAGQAEGLAEAWSGARIVITQGLGHRRIMRDPSVIAESVAFLDGKAGR